jgi:hypothetical protein
VGKTAAECSKQEAESVTSLATTPESVFPMDGLLLLLLLLRCFISTLDTMKTRICNHPQSRTALFAAAWCSAIDLALPHAPHQSRGRVVDHAVDAPLCGTVPARLQVVIAALSGCAHAIHAIQLEVCRFRQRRLDWVDGTDL